MRRRAVGARALNLALAIILAVGLMPTVPSSAFAQDYASQAAVQSDQADAQDDPADEAAGSVGQPADADGTAASGSQGGASAAGAQDLVSISTQADPDSAVPEAGATEAAGESGILALPNGVLAVGSPSAPVIGVQSLDANNAGIDEAASTFADDSGQHALSSIVANGGLAYSRSSETPYSFATVARFPDAGATNKKVSITLPLGLEWVGDGSSDTNLTAQLVSGAVGKSGRYVGYSGGVDVYKTRDYNFTDNISTATVSGSLYRMSYVTEQVLPEDIVITLSYDYGGTTHVDTWTSSTNGKVRLTGERFPGLYPDATNTAQGTLTVQAGSQASARQMWDAGEAGVLLDLMTYKIVMDFSSAPSDASMDSSLEVTSATDELFSLSAPVIDAAAKTKTYTVTSTKPIRWKGEVARYKRSGLVFNASSSLQSQEEVKCTIPSVTYQTYSATNSAVTTKDDPIGWQWTYKVLQDVEDVRVGARVVTSPYANVNVPGRGRTQQRCYIENYGGADSAPKEVIYDFSACQDVFGVSPAGISLAVPSGHSVDGFSYTLMDGRTGAVTFPTPKTAAPTTNGLACIDLEIGDFPGLSAGDWLKELRYELDTIPANSTMANGTSCAVRWTGTWLDESVTSVPVEFTVRDADYTGAAEQNTASRTVAMTYDRAQSARVVQTSSFVGDGAVSAGSTFTSFVRLASFSSPSTETRTEQPSIFLRDPSGNTIVKGSIKVVVTDGSGSSHDITADCSIRGPLADNTGTPYYIVDTSTVDPTLSTIGAAAYEYNGYSTLVDMWVYWDIATQPDASAATVNYGDAALMGLRTEKVRGVEAGTTETDDVYGMIPSDEGYYDKLYTQRANSYEIIPKVDLVVTNDSKHSSDPDTSYASYSDHGAIHVVEQEPVDKRVRVYNPSGATVARADIFRIIPKQGESWGDLIHAETTDASGTPGASSFPFSMELTEPVSIKAHDSHIQASSFEVKCAVVDTSQIAADGSNLPAVLQAAGWEDFNASRAALYNCVRVTGTNIAYLTDPAWSAEEEREHNTVDIVATTKLTVDPTNPSKPVDGLVAVWAPYYHEDLTTSDNKEFRTWQQGASMGVETSRGRIQGKVWLDANRNGVMEAGEDALPGWALNLYDPADTATPLKTAVSAMDGSYAFEYVSRGTDPANAPREYVLEVVNQDDTAYRFTATAGGRLDMKLTPAADHSSASAAATALLAAELPASNEAGDAAGVYNVGAYRVWPVTYATSAGGSVAYQQDAGADVGTSTNPEYVADGAGPAHVASPQADVGYGFTGWVADRFVTVNGTAKAAGTLLTTAEVRAAAIAGSTLFTAQFKPQHQVTYRLEGTSPAGASAPAAKSYTEGETVAVEAAPSVPAGYAFSGWEAETSGVRVSGGSFTMPASDVSFVGTWTAPADASLSVDKHISGRQWLAADSFGFTLTPNAGAPLRTSAGGASQASVTAIATAAVTDPAQAGNHPAHFPDIWFQLSDLGGASSKVFSYTVSETSAMPGGMTKAADREVRVRVTDDGAGTLRVAYLGYDESTGRLLDPSDERSWLQTADVPDMVNSYAVSGSVSATLKAAKEIQDASGDPAEGWRVAGHNWSDSEFSFVLLSSDDSTPMPAGASARADGHPGRFARSESPATLNEPVAAFGEITYTAPGTYYYDVREVCADAAASEPGYVEGLYIHNHLVYSTTAHRVVVTVADKGDGTLADPIVAYGAYESAQPSTFHNREQGDAELVLAGRKHLEGHALEAGMFSFELFEMNSATDADFSDAKRVDTGTVADIDADANTGIVEKVVEFNLSDLAGASSKTYYFAGREVEGSNRGVAYSQAVHRYEVLVEAIDSDFDGRHDTVRVASVRIDDGSGAPVTLTEANDDLERDSYGQLQVADSASWPVHENTYSASGTATIDASKHVAGRDSWLEDESYDFVLTAEDGAPLRVHEGRSAADKVSLTATARTDARIVDFDDLVFTQEDLTEKDASGKATGYASERQFSYRIHELCDEDGDEEDDNPASGGAERGGVTYAADHVITVKVVDNHDGTLSVTYLGRDGQWLNTPINPQFDNSYLAKGSVTARILGAKLLEGRDWMEGDSFALRLTAGANTAPAGTATPLPAGVSGGSATVEVTPSSPAASWDGSAAGTRVAPFGPIEFTCAGTYRYIVTEDVPAASDRLGGVTYDGSASVEVTVTVPDNGDGTLGEPVVSYGASADPVAIANTYAASPASLAIPVTKAVMGYPAASEWPEGTFFTFAISAVTSGAPVPVPATATVTASSPDAASGVLRSKTASFAPISFPAAGTYEYSVSEVPNSALAAAGWTFDGAARTVRIVVTDPGDGRLRAAVDPLTSASFTNLYEAPVAPPAPAVSDPPVRKAVTGEGAAEAAASAEFAFLMEAVTPNAPMPEGSEGGRLTATVRGAGSVEFGKMSYSEPGTYAYRISEVPDAALTEAGWSFDDAGWGITVTVADDGAGRLKVESSYTKDGAEVDIAEIVFTNAYEAPEPSPEPEPGKPAVSLSKSQDKAEVRVGDEVVYTLALRNSGDAPAYGLYVKDYVPEGTVYVSASGSGALYGATEAGREFATWWVPELVPGAAAEMTLTVRVVERRPGDKISNTAVWEAVASDDPNVPASEPQRPPASHDPDPASGGQSNASTATVLDDESAASPKPAKAAPAKGATPRTGDALAVGAGALAACALAAAALALAVRRRSNR